MRTFPSLKPQLSPKGSLLTSLQQTVRKVFAFVSRIDPLEATTSLSLFLLLLYSGDFWYLRVPVTLLVIAAMLYKPLRLSPSFWLLIGTVLFASNLRNWYLIDNHKYLITYWFFALGLSLGAKDPLEATKQNAKYLIGLAFLFATVWKLFSGDFMNAAFMHYTLLLDNRFADVAKYLGQMSVPEMLMNQRNVGDLLAFTSTESSVALIDTARIGFLARFLTIWTIILEGLIALLFLLPLKRSGSRDALLLLFVLTTYAIAPVIGFGSVLIIMGMVQTTSLRWRLAYGLSFLVLQLYTLPLSDFLALLLG